MLRRTAIAAPIVALAVAMPAPAAAVPVPMDTCAPGVVAAHTLPCLGDREHEQTALAAVARSGASVLWKVWSTTALVLF